MSALSDSHKIGFSGLLFKRCYLEFVPNVRSNLNLPNDWYAVNDRISFLVSLNPFMSRETHLPKLFELFRQHGYEGVSLSAISAATGLGRASLYHHFPGGKVEMVSATLDYSGRWIDENILPVLRSQGSAQVRLQQMCDRLNELYASGEKPCLLAALTTGATPDAFHESVVY